MISLKNLVVMVIILNKKGKVYFVLDIISTVIMFVSFAIFAFSMYTSYSFRDNPEEAYLFGYKPVVVLSGSMEPYLKTNGICIVKKTNYEDVKKDDVLMYSIDDKTITHRVIDITDNGIITKGDNNNERDAYLVQKKNVRAVVVGRMNFFSKPISEIIPNGIKKDVNKKALVKWIGYPIFVILVISTTKKIVVKISKEGEDNIGK